MRQPSSDNGFENRRTREVEIDVLVGHECASHSPASELLWERAGFSPPAGPVTIVYQEPCGTGRFADVSVTDLAGNKLVIEDKAAGGAFQVGQVENYATMISATVRTVLIAPASFLKLHEREAARFSAAVSLEELAAALQSVPNNSVMELRASYAHRRDEFLRCARDVGWTGSPDVDVAAFGQAYRRLAEEITKAEIELTRNTLTNRNASFVEFAPWAQNDNLKPLHKLAAGVIDVRVKGLSLPELRERLSSVPDETRLPNGWESATQRSSPYPVIRYRTIPIEGHLSGDLFTKYSDSIAQGLRALDELKLWLVMNAKVLDVELIR